MKEASDAEFLAQRCRDQERLLAAYRVGQTRPPVGAIDRLVKGTERWNRLKEGTK